MNLKQIKEYLDENNMFFGYRDTTREDYINRIYGSCKRQLDWRILDTEVDFNDSENDFYTSVYYKHFKDKDLSAKKKVQECNQYPKVAINSNNRYPENIMLILRQDEGLKDLDFSKDEELNQLSPNEVFEKVMVWEDMQEEMKYIKKWIKDIYNIDLNGIK